MGIKIGNLANILTLNYKVSWMFFLICFGKNYKCGKYGIPVSWEQETTTKLISHTVIMDDRKSFKRKVLKVKNFGIHQKPTFALKKWFPYKVSVFI